MRLTALAAALLATAPALAAPQPAPVAALVRAVDIPYTAFTLDNGLRVVVHTDRKAPIVSLHTWYDVGSADEPTGQSGYAHLFEHLMFAGSQHVANYDLPLENAGGSNNGSTTQDRTNYYVNAPKGALDLALFLEADRMGHLLPAIDQEKLDNQRGVVQNEKRQGDNRPYGLTYYALTEALFPPSHPYHHTPIGSMADLDRASLTNVQSWFNTHYSPNNAVIAISGDISPVDARAKVERFFGAIPRGPAATPRAPDVPPSAPLTRQIMHDRVPTARLYFAWIAPPAIAPEGTPLSVALTVLGGGGSSRLYNDLVRETKLATSVSADGIDGRRAGISLITVDVQPGVDPAKVEARVDAVLAEFLREGPTPDEVNRVATRAVADTIRGLETDNATASTLAEGWLFAGDPGFYKTQLARYAAAKPAQVLSTARAWIDPGHGFRLSVLPGERGPTELALVGASGVAPKAKKDALPVGDASLLPPVQRVDTLTFPTPERATLANGIKVTFVRRPGIPVVQLLASFDAGNSADPANARGTQALTIALMDEGTKRRTGPQIVEEGERLGASIGIAAGSDTTRGTLTALAPNLPQSLDLFADVVRNPAFAPDQVDRLRAIQLTEIAQEQASPGAIASRLLGPTIYGADHPYAGPASGETAVIKRLTRADLVAFQHAWVRPDNLQLFIVGDTTLAQLLPQLETSFGDWRPDPAIPRGRKSFPPARADRPTSILLVDRPHSPQSYIVAGEPLSVRGLDDPLPLTVANNLLGVSFTSRLNTDLRETRGWAYGVQSSVREAREQMAFRLAAPVQADKTGASVDVLRADIAGYRGAKPITADELARTANLTVLSLPGAFETSGALVAALQSNAVLGRPDDYYVRLPARYRALTAAEVAAAARAIDPTRFQWIVVGDAKVVAPQLSGLGLPVEVRPAAK